MLFVMEVGCFQLITYLMDGGVIVLGQVGIVGKLYTRGWSIALYTMSWGEVCGTKLT